MFLEEPNIALLAARLIYQRTAIKNIAAYAERIRYVSPIVKNQELELKIHITARYPKVATMKKNLFTSILGILKGIADFGKTFSRILAKETSPIIKNKKFSTEEQRIIRHYLAKGVRLSEINPIIFQDIARKKGETGNLIFRGKYQNGFPRDLTIQRDGNTKSDNRRQNKTQSGDFENRLPPEKSDTVSIDDFPQFVEELALNFSQTKYALITKIIYQNSARLVDVLSLRKGDLFSSSKCGAIYFSDKSCHKEIICWSKEFDIQLRNYCDTERKENDLMNRDLSEIGDSDFLFITREGNRISPDNFYAEWRKTCTKLNKSLALWELRQIASQNCKNNGISDEIG